MRAPIERGIRRPAGRALLLVLPIVFFHLSATVGAYLHFAFVAHERCPEHGELIHAEGDAAEPRRAAEPTERPSYQPGGGSSDEEHDVCALGDALREPAVEPAPAGSAAAEPALRSAPRVAETELLTGRAVHRVAPKTSPPLHA